MQLAHDVANGVDVPFEVVDASEVGNSFQPLWCYRTLTAEFISQRIGPIGNLPEYRAAAHELERVDGLDEWLLARGEQHVPATAPGRAKAVLNVFLAEVVGDEPTFDFDAQRFETSWALLDAMLFRGRTAVMLAAPIHGVDLESDDVRLADGTLLVTNRSAEAEGLPADIFRGDGLPVVVALVDVSDTNPESLSAARQQLRKLLSALRLFGDANPALAGAARMQVARGPWQVLSLEGSGSASGLLDIETESEAEFVEFYELVASRWPRNGEIAWALRRHEFGCDRMHHLDSLSDHLMALRALLEPEGPASGRLCQRIAALIAEPEDWPRLAERTARAVNLERCAVSGLSAHEPEAEVLCHEVSLHLRALLRDVIASHLDSDLRGVADSLIAKEAGVEELPTARRSRRFRSDDSDSDSIAA